MIDEMSAASQRCPAMFQHQGKSLGGLQSLCKVPGTSLVQDRHV